MSNETTTRFRVDINDLKKAMQEAKRVVAVANSEFKATSTAMDKWQKTTGGLKAKLTQLDTTLTAQKRMLSILQNEYDGLSDEEKENSKVADDLRIKMNNQQAQINKTEKSIQYYSDELKKAEQSEEIAAKTGEEATEVFDRLGREAKESGDDVKSAGDGFTVFKGVLSNLVTQGIDFAIDKLRDLGSAVFDTAKKVDELNTNSKITGVDVTTLQQWEYASRFIDTSVETMSSSMARLTKNMTSSSSSVVGAFDKLNVSTRNADGSLRNANDVFFDTIDALGKVKNETERDNLAMQIFGKSARDLNPLIEAGSDQLKAYGKEAEELGLIMDKSQIDKYQELNDAVDKVKSIGTGWIYDIGSAFLEGIDIDKVVENFEKIPEVLGKIKKVIDFLSPAFAGLSTVIAGLGIAGLISNLSTIVPMLMTWLTSTKLVTAGQWLLNVALTMNPIGLIIIAITGLIAALIVLWKKSDTFRNFIIGMWTGLINLFSGLPDKIKAIFSKVVDKVTELGNNLKTKGKAAAKKLLDSVINGIKSLPNKVKSVAGNIVTGLWSGISNKAAWLKSKIKGWVGDITSWLKKFFKIGSPSRLMADEIGKWLPAGIGVGIEKNAKSLYGSMQTMGATALSGLDSGLKSANSGTVVGGSVVNNYNQVINSPKPLSRLEIYRQSKNLLGFAGGR